MNYPKHASEVLKFAAIDLAAIHVYRILIRYESS